jgi:hypothetical protein
VLKARAFKSNFAPSAVASARYEIVHYQPDLRLRTSGEATYSGDNVYTGTGDEQLKTQYIAHGKAAAYLFKVQNDGNTADNLVITGTSGDSGWRVKFLEMGSNADITAQVTGTGWTTTTLAVGATAGLWVHVTPETTTVNGDIFPLQLTALSVRSAQNRDVVRVTTTK